MKTDLKDIRILYPYVKKHMLMISAGGVGIFVLSLLTLPGPFLTKYILDKIIPSKNLNLLIWAAVAIFALATFQEFIKLIVNNIFKRVNSKIILEVRIDLLKKITMAPLSVKEKFTNGYLISRILEDPMGLQAVFADKFIYILRNVFTVIVSTGAIFYLSVKLSLVTIVVLPIFVLTTIFFARIIKERYKVFYEKRAQNLSQLEESLRLLSLFKIFSKERLSLNSFEKTASSMRDSDIAVAKTGFWNSFTVENILAFIPLLIYSYGGYLIFEGSFTVGSLIAFTELLYNIFGPVHGLTSINLKMQNSIVSLSRIKEILSFETEDTGQKDLNNISNITFTNVNFKYPASESLQALDNINLSISKGDRIGVLGYSGSGKTTMGKLLLRLHNASSGEILINDINIEDIDLKSLRSKITYIDQEPRLINDSIYNNLALGLNEEEEKEASFMKIKNAIDESHSSFVYNLDEKLDHNPIREGGNLSVGQKQRISIARSFVLDPDVYILDEPSASLDGESEVKITEAIKRLPEDKIVFIITHRMNILKGCNRIIVMNEGKIIEEGSLKDLKNLDGFYKKFHELFYNDNEK